MAFHVTEICIQMVIFRAAIVQIAAYKPERQL